MEEEDAHDGVAIDAPKGIGLSLGKVDKAQDERKEQREYHGATKETFLLTYGTENEVGVLFGDILELGLGAVEESFPRNPPEPMAILA